MGAVFVFLSHVRLLSAQHFPQLLGFLAHVLLTLLQKEYINLSLSCHDIYKESVAMLLQSYKVQQVLQHRTQSSQKHKPLDE